MGTHPLVLWRVPGVLQPPSPQYGHQAHGEGQALPSAPQFMESDRLWVSRSRLGYSSRVQEKMHDDSSPGVLEGPWCSAAPLPKV